jgi:hypothetical protein
MAKLTVEKKEYSTGMNTMKITGFNDGELSELKSMVHEEAQEKILEMLDSRNGGLGSRWACGYGVYSLWFDEEAAYVNIGTSCD